MCSRPKIPAPTPIAAPPAEQDEKAPDLASTRRKRPASSGMAGGSLLTGPSGVSNNMLSTGGGSLLGG